MNKYYHLIWLDFLNNFLIVVHALISILSFRNLTHYTHIDYYYYFSKALVRFIKFNNPQNHERKFSLFFHFVSFVYYLDFFFVLFCYFQTKFCNGHWILHDGMITKYVQPMDSSEKNKLSASKFSCMCVCVRMRINTGKLSIEHIGLMRTNANDQTNKLVS